MTNEADVTVVIPVHNRGSVIATAIESVLQQTRTPRRIVVVDDGSTDDTRAVVESTSVELIVHDSPRGSGPARNTGIAAADTDWVAFLDSDDRWSPDHLEQAMAAVRGQVLVTAPMIDSFGRGRGNVSGTIRRIEHPDLFFPENIVCTSTVIARRDAILAVGGFSDLPRAQDLDLWIKLLEVGSGLALASPTAVYSLDTQYLEAGLRGRSLGGLARVQDRYSDRPWMSRRLIGAINTTRAWDELRYAQHEGDPRAMLHSARDLTRAPSPVSTLATLLRHRRRARRFATASR